MPRIRITPAGESATTGLPNTRASAEDMGAGIGRALSGAGQAMASVGNNMLAKEKQRQQFDQEIAFEKFKTQERQAYNDSLAMAPEGAQGFTEAYNTGFETRASGLYDGLDAESRQRMQLRVEQFRGSMVNQASGFEAASTATMRKQDVTELLNANVNAIRMNPNDYDQIVADMHRFVGTMPGLNGDTQAQLRDAFTQDATYARFDAMLDGAKTVGEIDDIYNSLGEGGWQTAMSKSNFDTILNKVSTRRDALGRLVATEASTLLDTMTKRVERDEYISEGDWGVLSDKIAAAGPAMTEGAVNAVANLRGQYDERQVLRGASATQTSALVNTLRLEAYGQAPTRSGFNGQVVSSVDGTVNPANFTGLTTATQTRTLELSRLFGEPLKITPHGGANNRESTASDHMNRIGTDIYIGDYSPEKRRQLVALAIANGATAIGGYGKGSEGYNTIHLGYRDSTGNGPGGLSTWYRPAPGQDVAAVDPSAPAWLREGVQLGLQYRSGNVTPTGQSMNFPEGSIQNTIVTRAKALGEDPAVALGIAYLENRSLDPNARNPVSSATGIFQITASTAASLGITDATDLNQNIDGGIRLMAQDKASVAKALNRSPDSFTPGERYLIHMLGMNDAIALLGADRGSPTNAVLDKKVIDGNFKFFGGKTVQQTVDLANREMAKAMGENISPYMAGRLQAAEAHQQNMVKGLTDAPLDYAVSQGAQPYSELDFSNPGQDNMSFYARAEYMTGVVDTYGDSGVQINKIFTESESEQLKKILDEGNADQKAAALGMVSQLGEYTNMALNQIGQDDPTAAYVAAMMARGDSEAQRVARGVLRGQDLLAGDSSATFKDMLKLDDFTTSRSVFNETTGYALLGMGSVNAAAEEAASALYLSRMVNATNKTFNERVYRQAVKDVLGGEIVEHNNLMVVLPSGVTPDDFDTFVERLTPEAQIDVSMSGEPPVFIDPEDGSATVVPPAFFVEDAQFVQVAAGKYGVQDSIGNVLFDTTGTPYIMEIDKTVVRRVIDSFVEMDAGERFGRGVADAVVTP